MVKESGLFFNDHSISLAYNTSTTHKMSNSNKEFFVVHVT
jgi:hypothetical protein